LFSHLYENFPEKSDDEDDDGRIKVAVIGKPNVGKSSLISDTLLFLLIPAVSISTYFPYSFSYSVSIASLVVPTCN